MIHTKNFVEKMAVVAWSTLLVFVPKPVCVYDVMSSGAVLGGLVTVILLMLCLSLVMPLSRLGEKVTNWAPVMTVRYSLNILLPVLGVCLLTHPVTPAWVGVVKKFLVLEGQLWKKWCPEAYIILVSLSCILAIFRRESLRVRLGTHTDPDRDKNIKMIKFAADQLCEQHMNKIVK